MQEPKIPGVDEGQRSSIELKTTAKGEVQGGVKIYAENTTLAAIDAAKEKAVQLFNELRTEVGI